MLISSPANLANLVLPYHRSFIEDDFDLLKSLCSSSTKVRIFDGTQRAPQDCGVGSLGSMVASWDEELGGPRFTLKALFFYPAMDGIGTFSATYWMDGHEWDAKQQEAVPFHSAFEDVVVFDNNGTIVSIERICHFDKDRKHAISPKA